MEVTLDDLKHHIGELAVENRALRRKIALDRETAAAALRRAEDEVARLRAENDRFRGAAPPPAAG